MTYDFRGTMGDCGEFTRKRVQCDDGTAARAYALGLAASWQMPVRYALVGDSGRVVYPNQCPISKAECAEWRHECAAGTHCWLKA